MRRELDRWRPGAGVPRLRWPEWPALVPRSTARRAYPSTAASGPPVSTLNRASAQAPQPDRCSRVSASSLLPRHGDISGSETPTVPRYVSMSGFKRELFWASGLTGWSGATPAAPDHPATKPQWLHSSRLRLLLSPP